MAEFLGFGAHFRWSAGVEAAPLTLDGALASAELGLQLLSARGTKRENSRAGLPPLVFDLRLSPEWSRWECFVHETSFQEYGARFVGEMLLAASRALNVRLGRSFNEGGHGIVRLEELDGALEFVDWLQYLGPELADRWGVSRLAEGPFHEVRPFADGACAIWLGQSPFQETLSRRQAADFLGCRLRPLIGKNAKDGSLLEIPWR